MVAIGSSNVKYTSQIEKDQHTVLAELASRVAGPKCRFLEIGSWAGDSTITLGRVAKKKGGILVCVDWWKGSEGTALQGLAENDVYSYFWERVCDAGLEDTVIPVRGDAKDSLLLFDEQSFDLVFVDGDHRYDHARHDIESSLRLVKDNGILCGHDCEGFVSDYDMTFLRFGKTMDTFESVHCGVVLAVGEIFPDYDIYHSIWCVELADGQWGKLATPPESVPRQRQTMPAPLKRFDSGTAYRYGNAVYLVPGTMAGADVRDEQVRDHPDVVKASSLEALERGHAEAGETASPVLLSPCVHGSNIVGYLDKYYVVPCDYGPLDLGFADVAGLIKDKVIWVEATYDDAEGTAREGLADMLAGGRFAEPLLVDMDCEGYDIYFMQGKLYALRIGDGGEARDAVGRRVFERRARPLEANGVLEARREIESSGFRLSRRDPTEPAPMGATIHKENDRIGDPLVSIILLDWECRELFFALEWLNRMDGDRSRFEIIWVELFNRVVPEAMEQCDVVMTLGQEGKYHKHKAYNAGLLKARGKIITVCDSDAVFQPNFIDSILESFGIPDGKGEPKSMVLMHHEYRSTEQYPEDGFEDIKGLSDFPWVDLWPNAGACLSVSRFDVIRFGGFDEDSSYRGYMCGPYDLGWRMVNANIPEIWYDEHKSALWHFAHPDPTGTYMPVSFKLWSEIAYPHIDGHALTAVDAFSSGRTMPLKENEQIHKLRMDRRVIGSELEARYSKLTGPGGFSRAQVGFLYFKLFLSTAKRGIVYPLRQRIRAWMKELAGRIDVGASDNPTFKQRLAAFLRSPRAEGLGLFKKVVGETVYKKIKDLYWNIKRD